MLRAATLSPGPTDSALASTQMHTRGKMPHPLRGFAKGGRTAQIYSGMNYSLGDPPESAFGR